MTTTYEADGTRYRSHADLPYGGTERRAPGLRCVVVDHNGNDCPAVYLPRQRFYEITLPTGTIRGVTRSMLDALGWSVHS